MAKDTPKRVVESYQPFLGQVRKVVEHAALNDPQGFKFLMHSITEIMNVAFLLMKNKLTP